MCKTLVTVVSVLALLLVPITEVQSSSDSSNSSELTELHIGGIFPINGKGGWWVRCDAIKFVWEELITVEHYSSSPRRQGGIACMPAAKLALEDVNSNKELLPGFKLNLHSNDSEVRGWAELFTKALICYCWRHNFGDEWRDGGKSFEVKELGGVNTDRQQLRTV